MRRTLAVTTVIITLGLAAPAAAQTEAANQPVAYVERPLTLPKMMLSPEVSTQIAHLDFGGGFSGTQFLVELGAAFGITDDFTVDAHPLGIVGGDVDTDYTRFEVGATYRFLKEPVEIGGRFRLEVQNGGTVALNPGLPVRIHAGKIVRIDTGVNFTLAIPTNGEDPYPGLVGIQTDYLKPGEVGFPFDISFQLAEPAFLGLSTGYAIGDLRHAGDSSFMPLGIFAGGTIRGDSGPLIDIGGSFGFPLFFLGSSDSNPNTELWVIGLVGRGYLSL